MTASGVDIKLVNGQSYHGRHGPIANNFRYRIDCLLVPAHTQAHATISLFSINKFNMFSFFDKDHGEGGSIENFARRIAKEHGFADHFEGEIWLLTQPRFFGYIFNPVSFWYFFDHDQNLRAVLAEVNNTVKGRHFYKCHHDDFSPISTGDKIHVEKLFYVSPFQEIAGQYDFKFQFDAASLGAWINFRNGDEGVYATLTGKVRTLNSMALIKSAILRPFGALRVIALIHWQALKLKMKGGQYRKAPPQKEERISR